MGWLSLGVSGVLTTRELGRKRAQRTKDNFSSSCNSAVPWSDLESTVTCVGLYASCGKDLLLLLDTCIHMQTDTGVLRCLGASGRSRAQLIRQPRLGPHPPFPPPITRG